MSLHENICETCKVRFTAVAKMHECYYCFKKRVGE